MLKNDRLSAIHVVPYYPPHQGGMERAAERLVAALSDSNIDARVITSALGGTSPAENPSRVQRLRGIEVAHTPVLWGLFPALWRMPRKAVVHAHVAQAFIPDAAVAVARRRGQPVVSHYHLDVDPSGRLGVLLRPYQRTLLRRTLHHSDIVVVPTPDYAGIVHDLYQVPPSRVRVIPNGTDYPVATIARRPPTQPWRLISVGRLSPQKDFPLLFGACAILRDRYPQLRWSLEVHGDGELRPELERQIDRLDLRGLVELGRGDLSRARLQGRYDEAHLFVLTTRKESFGIVYAEAMARGLPIVTTNAPGVRNVVHDGRNGLLAKPSPGAFAEAMVALLTDPERYVRISRTNLADAARWSWPAVAEQMAGLYRELLRPEAGCMEGERPS